MKSFFKYNNFERKGIIFLIIILLIVIAFYYFIPQIFVKEKTMNDEDFELKVKVFIEQREAERQRIEEEKQQRKEKALSKSTVVTENKKLTPFPFNPNNLPASKWKKIGFSDQQISIIKNYEKSGGKFYKKSDLKKIYGISQEEYHQIKDFIRIPKPKKVTHKKESAHISKKADTKIPEELHIEINNATIEDFKQVSGIGDVFALRIYKYRNLLGGFYDVKQLKEVYGIDDELFRNIKESFYIDTIRTQKIDLNYATFKEIVKHPYFTYEVTKNIIQYREKNGIFEKKEDLLEVPLIFEDLYQKISPYIILN